MKTPLEMTFRNATATCESRGDNIPFLAAFVVTPDQSLESAPLDGSQFTAARHLHQRRVRDDVEAFRRERVPDREGDPGPDDNEGQGAQVPQRVRVRQVVLGTS